MKAVILAAGKGSRLYPLTHHIPKPLLPLANRPTMHYAFDILKEAGITEICIVVGENESYMREALGDGSALDLQLSFVRQPEAKGLAHAVGYAKEWINGESFMLYLGDAIYDKPFSGLRARFESSGAICMPVVMPVDDPSRFGIAYVDADDNITRLVEKPKEWESNLCLIGTYFFGPELWDVLPDLQPSARGEYEITDAMQLLVNTGGKVIVGHYAGTWFDTGTLDSFLQTTAFLAGGKIMIEGSLAGEAGENVVIGTGAEVECESISNSVVMPGAKVKVSGKIEGSLIGGTTTRDGDVVNLRIWDADTLEG